MLAVLEGRMGRTAGSTPGDEVSGEPVWLERPVAREGSNGRTAGKTPVKVSGDSMVVGSCAERRANAVS